MRARRVARRTGRRTARRTTRRIFRRVRRRRRRRILVGGGLVLLAAGGTAAAIKMSQSDAQLVEEHTGQPAEDLTEEELLDAMERLGIQKLELTDEDQGAMAADAGGTAEHAAPAAPPPQPAPDDSYLDELERLAALRDQGIISEADFEAKKQQLLGL